jgi:hypothetical protein
MKNKGMNWSIPEKTNERRRLHLAAVAFMALSLFLVAPPSFAVADNDSNLAKLEEKFFQHTYPKETVDARLDRIEKTVFGEAKDGDEGARLSALVQAVPNLNSGSNSAPTQTARGGGSNSQAGRGGRPSAEPEEEDSEPAPIGNYPAIDAIERNAFAGKTYSQEPVNQRLARLETKYFGKPSASTDLTDRTDRLKAQSGVDVTKNAPLNADWADEDDDEPTNIAPPQPVARQGGDRQSFSGHNYADSFRKAGMIPQTSIPSNGMYGGMGNSGSSGTRMGMGSSSGSYGSGSGMYGGAAPAPRSRPPITSQDFEDDDDDDFPPPRTGAAPRTAPNIASAAPRAAGMGLNPQVTLMENAVFNKTFSKDALPTRLHRLEQALYPQEKPWTDKSLPERVNRLAAVIQVSPAGASPPARVAQSPQPAPNFNDDDGYPPTAPSRQRKGSGGLGKIINSIGNLIGGGFVGGYPVQSGNVVTDPRTGLLMDTVTGNLIDPATGMVIGQRSVQRYGTGFGSGVGTFGNGFSTGGLGIGTGGMRFGGGGMGMPMGGYGFGGGMWP